MTRSLNLQFDKDQPIYFVGIAGSGMAPLAEILSKQGFRVLGADPTSNSCSARLRALGIDVYDSHAASQVPKGAVIVSSSAVKDSNPELEFARSNGLKILHRSDVLADLVNRNRSVAVSGTHGKTSTTALISHVLESLGEDPTTAIGGVLRENGSSARIGKGNVFVAEVDESDGTLVKYKPSVGVITSIDHDHPDFYRDVEHTTEVFQQFSNQIVKEGFLVAAWDQKILRDLVLPEGVNRLGYGFAIGSDIRCIEYSPSESGVAFQALIERDKVRAFLPLYGKHNVLNALAALAVARAFELDVSKAADALAYFKGVERRQNIGIIDERLIVIDDYAHNPSKIKAFISGLHESWPGRNLYAVFQPHRFSRTTALQAGFADSFRGLRKLYLLPVYGAGEAEDPSLDMLSFAKQIAKESQTEVDFCPRFEDVLASLRHEIVKPAIISTIGAGNVTLLSKTLKEDFHGAQKPRDS